MNKTILTLLCAVIFSLAGNAQTYQGTPFGQGKYYAAASLSGLDLTYNKMTDWNLDLTAKGGYLFADNWMVTGQLGYNYRENAANAFELGAGLRYYIVQNGLYLGAGANYLHNNHNYDDFMPTVQIGYAYFLNRTVTLEPELYYNLSTKDSDYSGFGFRIGIGIYFE